MTATRWLLTVALTACGGSSTPAPQQAVDSSFPQPPPVGEPVTVDLVTGARELAPGAEIDVAVRFTIRPGWKIYWSNPGEAGKPTVANLELPAGFAASPLAYPAPQAFEGPGGERSYGYTKEVLLSTRVTAPEALAATEVPLVASASWLACEDVCTRGSKRVELSVPTVPVASEVTAVNEQLFASHRARLPLPLDEDACGLRVTDRGAEIDCSGVTALELFPDATTQAAMTGQLSVAGDRGARLELSVRPDARLDQLRGVLRAETAGQNSYYTVDWSVR